MDIQTILISNGFGIGLMIMLLISSRPTICRDTFSEKVYYDLIWVTIALCALEASSFIINGKQFAGARALNVAVNFLLFSINIVFVYIWTLYVDYRLFEDMDRLRTRYPLLALPAAVVLCLCVISLFQPVVFSVSADNVYSRTAYTTLPFCVSFGYLAYGEIMIYKNRNIAKNYIFLPSVVFIIPLLAGSILQLMFYGISVIWPCLAISMVSIYISVQGEFASIDSLSGLYSRQFLDRRLRKNAFASPPGWTFAGVMIDIDRFKSINDDYGHQEGDAAIRSVGRILRAATDYGDFAARYGGDEFVVIKSVRSEEDAVKLIESIEEHLRQENAARKHPYCLSFSYGVSLYGGEGDNTDDFIKRMDSSMYEEKRRKSSLFPERRHPDDDEYSGC